ncbi:MAG: MarR family winged helix-turn-helix transcriptional regulator, partial [Acidimicrobiales bacterium]
MPETRWLSDGEERAWRAYRRMRTLLDLQISRDLARDSGLSDPDYDVLSTLSEAPASSWRANVLAERLLWSTSRLAHHVGRMERRGLVARSDCRGDARGATVTLTAA